MVTPTPPSNIEFNWSCSTGCFVDKEMEQSVNVTELEVTDSGELNCSVIINDVEYTSESVVLKVTGPGMITFVRIKVCHINSTVQLKCRLMFAHA